MDCAIALSIPSKAILCSLVEYGSNGKVGKNHKKMELNYADVIISAMAYQITTPKIVYSTVYSGVDKKKKKHQSSASWPVWIPRSEVQ